MLEKLEAALTSTGLPFAHFGWSKAPAGDYGVWAEDGGSDLTADDAHAERAVTGTVDYFTRDASGQPRLTVEAALESIEGCAWEPPDILYEEDTGYIHYAWAFEVA